MDEVLRSDKWIYGILSADATLIAELAADVENDALAAVYMDEAPEGATYPFLIMQMLSDIDVKGIGAEVVIVDAVYQIRWVGETESYQDAKTALDRVDVLLHKQTGTQDDATITACSRDGTRVRFKETTNGRHYRHRGVNYRVLVEET
jgi:hypothetical protein